MGAGIDLAKPLTGEKMANSTPTHSEHETKWEIPVDFMRPDDYRGQPAGCNPEDGLDETFFAFSCEPSSMAGCGNKRTNERIRTDEKNCPSCFTYVRPGGFTGRLWRSG
jgi:hypothetical protein